ncbi:predicted protein [Nematostella vectensis]|uniref:Uncharacterized protein n=1 Tax=Nematostella vectensis TaxID=45351 RepID=A7S965_NEMVE|nr:predicted protein [Nematostella vectensis]|eukprot:XP_001631841.1 predicted protein [Nematostella vectensis]
MATTNPFFEFLLTESNFRYEHKQRLAENDVIGYTTLPRPLLAVWYLIKTKDIRYIDLLNKSIGATLKISSESVLLEKRLDDLCRRSSAQKKKLNVRGSVKQRLDFCTSACKVQHLRKEVVEIKDLVEERVESLNEKIKATVESVLFLMDKFGVGDDLSKRPEKYETIAESLKDVLEEIDAVQDDGYVELDGKKINVLGLVDRSVTWNAEPTTLPVEIDAQKASISIGAGGILSNFSDQIKMTSKKFVVVEWLNNAEDRCELTVLRGSEVLRQGGLVSVVFIALQQITHQDFTRQKCCKTSTHSARQAV